jgi:putative transposase
MNDRFELHMQRNQHALYNIHYHLILVTKYRKACITPAMFRLLKAQAEKVFGLYNIDVEEINYEADHVHLLLQAPPTVCISSVINSYKSTSSRLVRKEFADHLAKFYWKPYFWSRSYMILSSGGAPIEVIRKYIQEQGTPEHATKKRK